MSSKRSSAEKLTIPKEWTFHDPRVAADFDRHVREQLPWYDLATGIVAHVARQYLPRGGVVVDVGASTGNIGRALADTIKARAIVFHAIDSAAQMADSYQAPGTFEVVDVRDFDFERQRPDLIVCFLSLMFVPPSERRFVIDRIKKSLKCGGAAVVFDKMVPAPGYLGTVAYRLTLTAKHEAGASADEVIAKELSLAGTQRPMYPSELNEFHEIFRFGDFAGFVFEKSISVQERAKIVAPL